MLSKQHGIMSTHACARRYRSIKILCFGASPIYHKTLINYKVSIVRIKASVNKMESSCSYKDYVVTDTHSHTHKLTTITLRLCITKHSIIKIKNLIKKESFLFSLIFFSINITRFSLVSNIVLHNVNSVLLFTGLSPCQS